MSGTLLIVLPFHPDSRKEAARLLRLAADLEPSPRTDVEWLLYARHDTVQELGAVKHALRKFPRILFDTCPERASGHPTGGNTMFRNIALLVDRVQARRKENYDGALFLEPDCCPTRPNWINLIRNEWAKADNKPLVASSSIPELPVVLDTRNGNLQQTAKKSCRDNRLKWATAALAGEDTVRSKKMRVYSSGDWPKCPPKFFPALAHFPSAKMGESIAKARKVLIKPPVKKVDTTPLVARLVAGTESAT